MQGHLGGGLSLRIEFPIVGSTKQNINTKSSMETEIVAVDDFMPDIFWNRYLIVSQGYNVKDDYLHQYNKSSIFWRIMGRTQ